MNEDEEAAIARWVGGRDAEAFRAIFVRHSTMVYSTCRRILPTDGDAEEVAQECFEALAVASTPPARRLGPWLHRVATRLSLKRIRTESRRHKREKRYAREQETNSETEWNDVYRFVDEAVAELPEKFRVAVVARYLEAQTLESIAQNLEVSPRTVAYRVERGVVLIRRTLRKRGITIGATSLAAMMGENMAEAAAVPSSLTAALGKLAIVGPRAPSTIGVAKAIGGLVAMKKAGIAALFALGAVLAFWSVQEKSAESRSQTALLGRRLPQTNPSTEPARLAANTPTATKSSYGSPGGRSGRSEETDESSPVPTARPELIAGIGHRSSEAKVEPMGASISGVVQDLSTGKGLPGVAVSATSGVSEFGARTDWAGRFELTALAPGDYVVTSAVPRGYLPPAEHDIVNVRLREGAERTGVDFALQLGGAMEGLITLGDIPASLKRFELTHNMGAGEPYVEYIETDALGTYILTGLMPGGRTVHFRYTGAGRPTYKVPVIIEAGETTITDVKFLSGPASIEGMVYRDSQTPLVAQIEVHFLEQTFYTTSAVDGYYIVEDLPAGPVQILSFMGTRGDSDGPLQRRIFALELNEGDHVIQDIWFAERTLNCSVSNIPETNFVAFFAAFNGEVDFSEFDIQMLGVITHQRAAIGSVSADGTGALRNLEPGTYTIVAFSFPSNPSAVEALEGEALQVFIQHLAISNAELVTIEEAGGEVSLDLTF